MLIQQEYKTIAKNATYSYYYALYVIKGPWKPGEDAIVKDAYWSNKYTTKVVKGL